MRRWIETAQAICSTDPEITCVVLLNDSNIVVDDRAGVELHMLVDFESVPVKTIQTVLRTEPHEALAVLENGIDRCLSQTVIY